jgi:hypothetical protein
MSTVMEEVEHILGHRRTSRRFRQVTQVGQLTELLPETVIKVDGQRVTAGVYDGYHRVIQLWRAGHRIEVEF